MCPFGLNLCRYRTDTSGMAFPAPFLHRTAGRPLRDPVRSAGPRARPDQDPGVAASRPRRAGSSVPGATELVERLTRGSDGVRFTDRTDGTPVPPAVQGVALQVLESWLAPVGRGDVPDHRATARMRITDGELVLSVQTVPRSPGGASFVPNLFERARLGEIVEGHGGRLLARATADRNRIAIVHLPLDAAGA